MHDAPAMPAQALARVPLQLKPPLAVLRSYRPHDYTIADVFASRLAGQAGKPFLVYEGRTRSWGEFDADVARAAILLRRKGISAGDRVGIVARNHPAHVLLLFALARLGATMVPVNPEFGVAEAGYVLQHAELSGVACDAASLQTVRAACTERGLAPWMVLLDDASSAADEAPRCCSNCSIRSIRPMRRRRKAVPNPSA